VSIFFQNPPFVSAKIAQKGHNAKKPNASFALSFFSTTFAAELEKKQRLANGRDARAASM
jgi:hypothetical protein